MGIQSFTTCFHKSVALEWVHVLHILHKLKEERQCCNDDDGADDQNTSTGVNTVPIIDIDAKNVAFRLTGNLAESPEFLSLIRVVVFSAIQVTVAVLNFFLST